jgi:hypothetical protein
MPEICFQVVYGTTQTTGANPDKYRAIPGGYLC